MSFTTWRKRVALLGLVVPTLAAVVAAPSSASTATRQECTSSTPYVAGVDGYDTYRIPAIVRSNSGTLLAFAEGRHNSAADSGDIDTVLRRSFDGGCTWGPMQVVATAANQGTAGNPAPVVLPDGRILLLTTHNAASATETEIMAGTVSAADSRRVFVQYSDTDGRTWSAARDITSETKLPNWRWYATGPGHALVLRGGPHAGRIVVPANHSSAPPAGSTDTGTEAKYYGGNDIYSDDGGRTWHIGFTDDTAGTSREDVAANETAVAQLPNGLLYFNSRNQSASATASRVDAYSVDGTRLIEPYQPQPGLIGPICEGSLLQTSRRDLLLFAGPSSPSSRAVMQLRVSNDGGHTWHVGLTVSQAPAAYSDLVQLDPGHVGLLFETGTTSSSQTLTFLRISLSQLAA